MSKLKGYIASHFFDRGGFMQTEELHDYLSDRYPNIDWYVPQNNDSINNKKENDITITDVGVYEADIVDQLMKCDILIACCDGVEIDSGVASEIVSKATQNEISGKCDLIVGYTTDMRRNETPRDFLDNIQELMEDNEPITALNNLETHKENFLYRNILVTGAVNKWGKMVIGDASNDEYMNKISNVIDAWLRKEGG